MKQILLFIWQLPQEVIGYIISRIWKRELVLLFDDTISNVKATEQENGVKIYVVSGESHKNHKILRHLSAFSIGRYICISSHYNDVSVKHELGHSIQSRYLGPFYLFAVGIPSIYGNIVDKTKHSNWSSVEKRMWYFNRYPENWADKLGGVKRV
jgi:hypothetical protein